MSITSYTLPDLTNIVRTPIAVNGTESGSGVSLNFAGLINQPFGPTSAVFDFGTSISLDITANVDHSTPVDPIPPGAQITKIVLRQQTSVVASGSTDTTAITPAVYPAAGSLRATSFSIFQQLMATSPDTSLWVTGDNHVSLSDTVHDIAVDPTHLHVIALSSLNNGSLSEYVYDFTTNPNGDFPLGYMDYTTFLANFSAIEILATCSVHGQSDPSPTASNSGTVLNSISATTSNWEMEVTWNVPTQWTISPSTVNLPDNVITITRPDPGVPSDQDTEIIDTLYINGHKIEPDDPWVIEWFRFRIVIHLIIKFDDDPPDQLVIEAQLIGTEFSGSVLLGLLTVNYTDLSGIYEFDENTHHDQLYARTTTSTTVTTQNVAIPAPFFVTAYIDSDDKDILHFVGTRLRVSGAGTLKQSLNSLDFINIEALPDLTLRTRNNLNPFTLANFIDQNAALRVYMSSTDDFMNVCNIIMFSKALYSGWPQ